VVGASTDEATLTVVDSVISNNPGGGVEATALTRGRLRVVNSTITNSGGGFFATKSSVIRDSVIDGNAFFGGATNGRLTVKNSQITNNGTVGLRGAEKNRILDSTISGNADEGILLNIGSERLRVLRSTIDGNGSDGMFTHGVRTLIRDSTITNNGGDGIEHPGLSLKVFDTTISGNGVHGIFAPGVFGCDVRTVNSTLTANGTDPGCGATFTCADLALCAPPNVISSTCETSYDTNSGFPGTSWGVCSLD